MRRLTLSIVAVFALSGQGLAASDLALKAMYCAKIEALTLDWYRSEGESAVAAQPPVQRKQTEAVMQNGLLEISAAYDRFRLYALSSLDPTNRADGMALAAAEGRAEADFTQCKKEIADKIQCIKPCARMCTVGSVACRSGCTLQCDATTCARTSACADSTWLPPR
jgi:hypothetical protein